MNEYELDGNRLVPRERADERVETLDQEWHVQRRKPGIQTGGSTVEQMLSVARTRLRRLSPDEAYEAVAKAAAILVDIRPEGQRAIEGIIPDALIVERNVLEWRFDPLSSSRLPVATNHAIQVIVFCSEGYTSSLAAQSAHPLRAMHEIHQQYPSRARAQDPEELRPQGLRHSLRSRTRSPGGHDRSRPAAAH